MRVNDNIIVEGISDPVNNIVKHVHNSIVYCSWLVRYVMLMYMYVCYVMCNVNHDVIDNNSSNSRPRCLRWNSF